VNETPFPANHLDLPQSAPNIPFFRAKWPSEHMRIILIFQPQLEVASLIDATVVLPRRASLRLVYFVAAAT